MAGGILASNIRWAVRQLGPFHETDISMIATMTGHEGGQATARMGTGKERGSDWMVESRFRRRLRCVLAAPWQIIGR
jgi:hypothetical protein